MNVVVICYLYGSLLLYLVTGGADFGAGVAELFTPAGEKRHIRELMRKLTSPIWEADHMWLILAIVILFVGFPDIYAQISTSLFIPITIMLLGIIGRGTSYAFRNTDYGHDRLKNADNFIYVSSSVIAPFFLGVIASAVFAGNQPEKDTFSAAYIYNWFNYFSLSTGFLTVMFCGYLSVIYTLARFPEERHYLRFQLRWLSLMFFAAVLLVVYNPVFDRLLPNQFPGVAISTTIVVLTAVILYVTCKVVYSNYSKWARLFAIIPVLFTILILLYTHSPGGDPGRLHLPLNTNSDIGKTIDALGRTLIIASFLIVPALGYLLYKFEFPHCMEHDIGDESK